LCPAPVYVGNIGRGLQDLLGGLGLVDGGQKPLELGGAVLAVQLADDGPVVDVERREQAPGWRRKNALTRIPSKRGWRLRQGQVVNHLVAEQPPRFDAGVEVPAPRPGAGLDLR
jgi:hypothetical protein